MNTLKEIIFNLKTVDGMVYVGMGAALIVGNITGLNPILGMLCLAIGAYKMMSK